MKDELQKLRDAAQRTGQRHSEPSPQWCGKDGKWLDVWTDEAEAPIAARAMIGRTDTESMFTCIVYSVELENAIDNPFLIAARVGTAAMIEAYRATFP